MKSSTRWAVAAGGIVSVVAVGTTVGVLLTSTPAPSPDDVFISRLEDQGISIVDRDKAIEFGHTVCSAVEADFPAWMIADTIYTASGSFTAQESLAIVNISRSTYCPEEKS